MKHLFNIFLALGVVLMAATASATPIAVAGGDNAVIAAARSLGHGGDYSIPYGAKNHILATAQTDLYEHPCSTCAIISTTLTPIGSNLAGDVSRADPVPVNFLISHIIRKPPRA